MNDLKDDSGPPWEGWAVLELMGHRRLGGYVREVSMFGASLLRIDVPEVEGQPAATQFYTSTAIYAITPTTEELARAVARGNRPAPVHRYELPPPKPDPAPSRVSYRYSDRDDPTEDLDDERDDD